MGIGDYIDAGGDAGEFLYPIGFETATERMGKPITTQYLVKPWIPRHSLSFMFGESGCGKTFIALDMAASIAMGLPDWQGYKAHQGNVLYVGGEDEDGMTARLVAVAIRYGVDGIPGLYTIKSEFSLTEPKAYELLVRTIRNRLRIKPDLIVFDTLNVYYGGDENSSTDYGTFKRDFLSPLMAEFGCSILILHHSGIIDKDRMRGTTAMKGGANTVIKVEKDKDDVVTLTLDKCRNNKAQVEESVRLKEIPLPALGMDEDGEIATSMIVVPYDGTKLTQTAAKYLEILKPAIGDAGTVSEEGCFIGGDELRGWMRCHEFSDDQIKKAFSRDPSRLLGRLEAEKVIAISEAYGKKTITVIDEDIAKEIQDASAGAGTAEISEIEEDEEEDVFG
jgi:hypothetical protein